MVVLLVQWFPPLTHTSLLTGEPSSFFRSLKTALFSIDLLNWEHFWWVCTVRGSTIYIMGRDLGETEGDSPPKIWGGGRPMDPSPPIFWEVVLLDACQSMNWLKRWNRGSSARKRSYMLQARQTGGKKTDKIWRWLKKCHQKFRMSTWKMFHKKGKKVIRKFGPQNCFPSPQTRRQVSTHALHKCIDTIQYKHQGNQLFRG